VRARISDALARFVGPTLQTPPMYSAVRLGGRRLYALARTGARVERPARPIAVERLELLGIENGGTTLRLRIACSEGTYVRTLCEDIGKALGTCAHMGALLREASGPFRLADSRTLEQIADERCAALIPPEAVIPLPTIVLDRGSADAFRAGRVVPLQSASPAETRQVFVRDDERAFVGVGEATGRRLAPRKVFAGP
jgi:tRNA pseudouridine55 synthase